MKPKQLVFDGESRAISYGWVIRGEESELVCGISYAYKDEYCARVDPDSMLSMKPKTFETLQEAKNYCQQQFDAFVLSLLESNQ